ncbi:MAG: HAD hydrolase-like protein, partial [Candidatus Levyibacteriota bacterium]
VYNQPIASIMELEYHGMVDTEILIEVLKLHGVSEGEAKSKITQAIAAMVHYYEAHKETGKHIVLDGAVDILQELQKKHIPAGLLTGNTEKIGWAKMKSVGLKDYFTFGAFGDLAFKRIDLINVAQERLETILQSQIPLKHFVIIGDTPLDIACAKAGGIEVIAVSTGKYSTRELQKHDPDLIIESLHEKDKIFKFLRID